MLKASMQSGKPAFWSWRGLSYQVYRLKKSA